MMSTRRSLFVFGALVAVGVLLAPQSAFAQLQADDVPTSVVVTAGTPASSSLKVEWKPPTARSGFVASMKWSGRRVQLRERAPQLHPLRKRHSPPAPALRASLPLHDYGLDCVKDLHRLGSCGSHEPRSDHQLDHG